MHGITSPRRLIFHHRRRKVSSFVVPAGTDKEWEVGCSSGFLFGLAAAVVIVERLELQSMLIWISDCCCKFLEVFLCNLVGSVKHL